MARHDKPSVSGASGFSDSALVNQTGVLACVSAAPRFSPEFQDPARLDPLTPSLLPKRFVSCHTRSLGLSPTTLLPERQALFAGDILSIFTYPTNLLVLLRSPRLLSSGTANQSVST